MNTYRFEFTFFSLYLLAIIKISTLLKAKSLNIYIYMYNLYTDNFCDIS